MTYDSRPDTWAHIHQVRRRLSEVIQDLLKRSEEHDLTKLEEPELRVFDEYSGELGKVDYNSPEYKAMLAGMAPGLRHHYGANDHHPEHFIGEYVTGNRYETDLRSRSMQGDLILPPNAGVKGMNLVQLLEMLCDWKAATSRMKDGGDLRTSIEVNSERFGYGEEIKNLLLYTAAYFGWL